VSPRKSRRTSRDNKKVESKPRAGLEPKKPSGFRYPAEKAVAEAGGKKVSEAKIPTLEGFPAYNPSVHGPLATFSAPEGHVVLDKYWIDEPFVLACITENPKTKERLYHVVEPSLEKVQGIFADLINYLKFKFSLEEVTEGWENALLHHISQFLRVGGRKIDVKDAYSLFYHAKRECFGFKEIDALMKDAEIEDISCNGLGVPIFLYHRKYYNIPTNIVFTDEERLNNLVISLVERCGKMISFGKPTVDATLPDGSRLQATLGTEITTRGSTFTIRKFAKEPFTPVHLLKHKTYSAEMLAYLWLAVENKKNIIIVGETASGKTSTLNALSLFIPPDAKIISLEETRELTLYQQNWIPSVTRATIGEGGGGITLYDLLLQAMRQRPECLIVGEVRGKEGLTLFQAMSTGHTCYSTLHSSSIEEAINRLEGAPLNIPHNMIAALDIACFQSISYLGQQRVRRAQSIVEIAGIDPATNSLRVQEVFRWVPSKDTFEQVAASVVLREIAERRGWSQDRLRKELETRARLLEYLLENNIIDHDKVSQFMRLYHISPDEAVKKISREKQRR